MILLTFHRPLSDADREHIRAAFTAVKDGDEKIIVVEEATAKSDDDEALTFSGIISRDHQEQSHA